MSIVGHFRTVVPHLRHRLRPMRPPPSRIWSAETEEPGPRRVRFHGRLSVPGDADHVVVVVHGLGGTYDRPYCVRAACAAHRAGLACVRIALRGAGGTGEDLYHAGLTADLHAALRSPALAAFRDVSVIGYSVGGHVALRFATETEDARVRGVAAVSAPVDLAACQRFLDERAWAFYRRSVLDALVEAYAALDARGNAPTPVEALRGVTTIRGFDELAIVPRFGFRDVDHYYASQSVALGEFRPRVATLYAGSRADPMVPPEVVDAGLARMADRLTVWWTRGGGHVALPVTERGRRHRTFEDQLVAWLVDRTPSSQRGARAPHVSSTRTV